MTDDPLREAMRAGRFAEGLARSGSDAWQRVAAMTPAERAEYQAAAAERYAAEQAWRRSWRGRWSRLRQRLGLAALTR